MRMRTSHSQKTHTPKTHPKQGNSSAQGTRYSARSRHLNAHLHTVMKDTHPKQGNSSSPVQGKQTDAVYSIQRKGSATGAGGGGSTGSSGRFPADGTPRLNIQTTATTRTRYSARGRQHARGVCSTGTSGESPAKATPRLNAQVRK